MRPLAIVILFAGYALVYASVANHGRFTEEPWQGLFADAYTPLPPPETPTTTAHHAIRPSHTQQPGITHFPRHK